MIKYLALALLLAAVFADDAQPAYPLWPKKFKQTFKEDIQFPLKSEEHTNGEYLYDEDAGCYQIKRDSCKNDRYTLDSAPCTHIVKDSNRYIYKPEKKSCCYCCNASKGCGILKSTWMNGAQYLGEGSYQTESGETVATYMWDQKGLQSNYYNETQAENPLDRTMILIDQVGDDQMYFDKDSLLLDFEEDVCALPSECTLDDKCFWSVCTGLRGEENPTTE